jgi:hypothetical protein
MQIHCETCKKGLEFNGERPSFCAFCGLPIPAVASGMAHTATYQPALRTIGGEATALPAHNRVARFLGESIASPISIGGYRILRSLGSGGMGTVFEAEDPSHGRRVAIKVIKPQIAASAENLERFRQEGRLASLIAHPRCVFVYHADEESGRPFIVMELMPGATLKEIVANLQAQRQTLQIGQALNKILDVIDGLQAAHAIGVIHRDVKPSNCFVLEDGHVKIGDFGLSKFLPSQSTGRKTTTPITGVEPVDEDDRITRTGTFVGTPLFASPEQIKGEVVDYRTDIYSVAATLYFLLTGKAPFEGGDNTATIARIVSEDPTPISEYRPDVSPELDRVILRGLERNRELRYASLAEFRLALLPFLPGYQQNASRTARLRAAVVDGAILAPLVLLSYQVMPHILSKDKWGHELVDFVGDLFMWVIVLGYFLATEVAAGASFGKWLLRLRVGGLRPGKPPKRRQLILRTLGFFVIVALPGILGLVLTGHDWVKWTLHGLGFLLLIDTMRAKGGYRGLHEVLSRTCVVQLPATPPPLQFPVFPPREPAPLPPGLPERVGNYAIHGIHRVLDDRIFLEGMDLILDRQVWLVLRPKAEGMIPPARREVSRTTRLRWLGGGEVTVHNRTHKSKHLWDAYIAPTTGCSLTQYVGVRKTVPWVVARSILLQLTEELTISMADGTFPDELGSDQIWLQPDGQIMIIGARFQSPGAHDEITTGSENERAMKFLRQTARFMLEGKRSKDNQPRPIQAPVPIHDRPIADRLAGIRDAYSNPAELVKDLKTSLTQPCEITLSARLGQILLHSALLSPILLAILLLGRYYHEIQPTLRYTHQVRRADRVIDWLNDPANHAEFAQFIRRHPQELELFPAWKAIDMILALEDAARRRPERLALKDPFERLTTVHYLNKIKERRDKDAHELDALTKQLSVAAMLPTMVAIELMPTPKDRPLAIVPPRPGAPPASSFDETLITTIRHAFDSRDVTDERMPIIQNRTAFQLAALVVGSWFFVWVFWAALTRGGISLRLMGIDLQTRRGQPAGPLRCGYRSFLVWLPFFSLLFFSVVMQDYFRGKEQSAAYLWLHWTPWWLAVIYLAGCALSALVHPQRGSHDRLAGVYLMPK